jgi:hypothetical protein
LASSASRIRPGTAHRAEQRRAELRVLAEEADEAGDGGTQPPAEEADEAGDGGTQPLTSAIACMAPSARFG